MSSIRFNAPLIEATTPSRFSWLNLREEIGSALEYGRAIGALSSLVALAGLLYWCPRCGQWMGEGSEGQGSGAPAPQAPPPPRRLIRALSEPVTSEPISRSENPRRHQNRLTEEGVLKHPTRFKGVAARESYGPPSQAHGRTVDTYYGGSPKSDSRPHGHDKQFIRGDGEQIPIYDRAKDGTIVYESGTEVVYNRDDRVYEWEPKTEDKGGLQE